jgi:integrase/recombinase XerD
MSKPDRKLITELKALLTNQQYSPVAVGNYCAYARGFLDYLAQRNMLVADVTEAQWERYLCV